MTREEAIQFLDNMRGHESGRAIGAEGFYAELCGYHMQALNMAIKALEQEPCEDANANQHNSNALNDVGQHKNALEEDAISRQAAIDAVAFGITYATGVNMETGEVKQMFVESNDELQKAINRICELPSVTPKAEPCDDAISRQAVLESIFDDDTEYTGSEICNMVRNLPSVNPQPKTGHWIKDDITERSKSAYKHKCNRCGAYHRAMYDYCPSCGAKMEE